MKPFFALIAISFLLTACGGVNEADFKSQVPETPSVQDVDESAVEAEAQLDVETEEEVEEVMVELPTQINLPAPFYSQAPEGDWSEPWQNACEESSLLVAHYGMTGEPIDKETFKKKVLEMVNWEVEHFGYYESTPVDMVVELYENYFEDAFDVHVLEAPTVEDLKQELAQGHLIVAPFAGQILGNPFYSGEGPYYHMMVLKGYDETHFITHDVGTRHGENFIYTYEAIMNALHDYDETSIYTQPARVIVLEG